MKYSGLTLNDDKLIFCLVEKKRFTLTRVNQKKKKKPKNVSSERGRKRRKIITSTRPSDQTMKRYFRLPRNLSIIQFHGKRNNIKINA
jgi:hypothetical protein